MKMHVILVKDENGVYNERYIFTSKSAREVKNFGIPGFLSVISTSRVKHPSPEVMRIALEQFGIDVGEFYNVCNEIKNELELVSE